MQDHAYLQVRRHTAVRCPIQGALNTWSPLSEKSTQYIAMRRRSILDKLKAACTKCDNSGLRCANKDGEGVHLVRFEAFPPHLERALSMFPPLARPC